MFTRKVSTAPVCIKLLSFCHHYEGKEINLVNKWFFQIILQTNEVKVTQVSEVLLAQSKKS